MDDLNLQWQHAKQFSNLQYMFCFDASCFGVRQHTRSHDSLCEGMRRVSVARAPPFDDQRLLHLAFKTQITREGQRQVGIVVCKV